MPSSVGANAGGAGSAAVAMTLTIDNPVAKTMTRKRFVTSPSSGFLTLQTFTVPRHLNEATRNGGWPRPPPVSRAISAGCFTSAGDRR
jgi:hypothetical protein